MFNSDTDRHVRLSITRFFAANGFAPTSYEIATINGLKNSEVEAAFERLEKHDQLLLSANGNTLRAAHPYSAVPTAYWVETGERGWWANCAFCALGVAVIAGSPARIHARIGAMSEPVTLFTSDRWISDKALCLHIPLPIRCWHDDIDFTCSNVHFFKDVKGIDKWSGMNSLPRGVGVSLEDAWVLARTWYENYLDDDWSPHSAQRLRDIFDTCGLTGEFWEVLSR